jgi:bacillithiol synthase
MKFNQTNVDYQSTGYFSSLILDFLKKDKNLENFYSFFPDYEGFQKAINARKYSFNRKVLADVIIQQNVNAGLYPSAKTSENINLLRSENTFTVTTGHQLCLFTGPLYFLYKIITTINLAESLKSKFPDKNFVPVFWMASEDHDFEEVNHINLFNNKLTWNPLHAAKGPVGKYSTSTVSDLLRDIKTKIGDSENALKLSALLDDAYTQTNTLSDATRVLVNNLFNEYGLICLDANDSKLKDALIPVMKEDIFYQSSFNEVNKSIEAIKMAGYQKVQVNPREINFFYMKPGLRERIVASGEDFKVLNTDMVFSKSELNTEIDNFPEHFSPNVVLRPLYQEMILPNIAYIGGGGELAYWLELKRLFEFHNVNFPVLMLRNSVLWIDSISAERMEKLEINILDLFFETEKLVKEFIARNSDEDINLNTQIEKLSAIYLEISELATKIDSTLKGAVESDLQKAIQSFKNLEQKISKAEKNKHETGINQLKKLKEKLFPGNGLQERYENFIPYYIKYGPQFIADLKSGLMPLDFNFTVFTEMNLKEAVK